MKTRFAMLFAFISAATAAVSAQPRTEGATSPFTYEAVGATPSLSLGKARHAKAVDGTAATQASKAPAAKLTRAVPVGAFTYELRGTAPKGKEIEEPATTAERSSRESAR